MVREKQTGDVYAMKTLRKEQSRKRADEERDVLATATGPWLPKLQYAFQVSANQIERIVLKLCYAENSHFKSSSSNSHMIVT